MAEEANAVATEQFIFLLNRFVRFKVSDVAIPSPQEVVNELYGGDIVQGKVVDLTESGSQERMRPISADRVGARPRRV
jgi:hypothetical protein